MIYDNNNWVESSNRILDQSINLVVSVSGDGYTLVHGYRGAAGNHVPNGCAVYQLE